MPEAERELILAEYQAMAFVLRTRPRGSSAMVEIRVGHLWTIRDGKLASLEIFPEREKALQAAEAPPD
jgi:hypothetical protein